MPSEFDISDTDTIVCSTKSTRNGFRHSCKYMRKNREIESRSVSYTNRTWERYEYETAISDLLDKMHLEKDEKKHVMDITSGKAEADLDERFGTTSMVAAMGDIFGKTKKESNEWKLRMIKAGMGEGISIPDDWDELSEDEKGSRLDKIIEFTKRKK